MYVLVLGLDVLGNPFGVIRGLAEGIEDLFYEPYQGAIQGPEEFAEGLANGVKSLLGHAVGESYLLDKHFRGSESNYYFYIIGLNMTVTKCLFKPFNDAMLSSLGRWKSDCSIS